MCWTPKADLRSFNRWGRNKIRFYLKQKGISAAVCDEALQTIDADHYRRMIGAELTKKRKGLKGNSCEIWAKLARYGTSRGYEMELMHNYLEQLSNEG